GGEAVRGGEAGGEPAPGEGGGHLAGPDEADARRLVHGVVSFLAGLTATARLYQAQRRDANPRAKNLPPTHPSRPSCHASSRPALLDARPAARRHALVSRAEPLSLVRPGRGGSGLAVRHDGSAAVQPGPRPGPGRTVGL